MFSKRKYIHEVFSYLRCLTFKTSLKKQNRRTKISKQKSKKPNSFMPFSSSVPWNYLFYSGVLKRIISSTLDTSVWSTLLSSSASPSYLLRCIILTKDSIFNFNVCNPSLPPRLNNILQTYTFRYFPSNLQFLHTNCFSTGPRLRMADQMPRCWKWKIWLIVLSGSLLNRWISELQILHPVK